MLAAIFEAGDLEQPFDRAEIRHDHLKVAHRAGEEIRPQGLVRGRILEDAAARDARGLHACALQKLAPPPGRFLIGDVDGRRVEGERSGAKPRHRYEAPLAVSVDLEQQILALLRRHGCSSCLDCAQQKRRLAPPS
jgi:hypothetical protein